MERTLEGLTLRERAAQLVMPWMAGGYASVSSVEMERLRALVEELGVGGVVISVGQPHTYAARLNALQSAARVPLLVASDFESGGPGMRLGGVYHLPSLLSLGGGTELPSTMAFGAIGDEAFAREAGRITGREARAVGVHLTFAPVLDVNSDPANPIINTRAFGEDPGLVARLGAAFVEGAREAGLMTTAKHFPGHGDTREDSHIDLPVVDADRARLDSVELVPFRRAIGAGVDAVMTAHVAVPRVEGPEAPPATLSPYFLSGILRGEMGFGGLLITDALDMGAIVRRYAGGEAAVRALEAGADVLLMPPDPRTALEAVARAVEEGRLDEARLDASVRRVLEAKARAGLHRGRRTDLEAVDRLVATAEHLSFAEEAAARSIAVPRDAEGLVPLDARAAGRTLSLTFARREDLAAGRAFDARLATALPVLDRRRADFGTPTAAWDSLRAAADSADLVLVSVHVPPRTAAGSVDVPDELVAFVDHALDGGARLALLSFGSPYMVARFPRVGTVLLAWGGAPVSQRAAAAALLGEEPVTARLPVSLPPDHRRGEGLRRPVVVAAPVAAGAESEAAGAAMDSALLARVDRILRVAIADSVTPGAALVVGRHGHLVRLRGYGRTDWAPGAPPVTDSTLYDLASLTKVVGTTTLVMRLVETGRLSPGDRASEYLPEWQGGPKEAITIRQLLLHRAGLAPFRDWWRDRRGPEAYRRALAEEPLAYEPGERTVYSDLGFIALGWIAEAACGKALDACLEEEIFRPLGMRETGFRPEPALLPRIAPTEMDTVFRRTHVVGVVHDENAYALGGVAGHAGLFSSARDLARFAGFLLEGAPRGAGDVDPEPARAFREATVTAFTSRHDTTSSRALGWDTAEPRLPGTAAGADPAGDVAGEARPPRAPFGHTGFTGTSLWVYPERDLFVVLLTNRVNPTRENRGHTLLRRAVHEAVLRAVTDERE